MVKWCWWTQQHKKAWTTTEDNSSGYSEDPLHGKEKWACIASSGTGLLVFSDDVTEDRSSRMNSEVCRDIFSAQIQLNGAKLIGRRFIVQMDDDPKHTAKATQEFLKVKKWIILQWPSQSPDLNPIEHAFHLLKTKLKTERPTNKQHLTGPNCTLL